MQQSAVDLIDRILELRVGQPFRNQVTFEVVAELGDLQQPAGLDFKCHLFSEGLTYTQFKDSIDEINRALLHELAAAEIVIPFPTAVEIQRDGD